MSPLSGTLNVAFCTPQPNAAPAQWTVPYCAPWLGGPLRRQGEFVQNYYAVASAPLANEVALISGQGPTAQTASDCPSFSRITPGRKGPRAEVLGNGWMYPPATKTLADELTSAGHSWKAYVGGLPAGAGTACRQNERPVGRLVPCRGWPPPTAS